MQGRQSWRVLQRFVDDFFALRNLFVPSRPSRRRAISIHPNRLRTIAEWRSVTLIS